MKYTILTILLIPVVLGGIMLKTVLPEEEPETTLQVIEYYEPETTRYYEPETTRYYCNEAELNEYFSSIVEETETTNSGITGNMLDELIDSLNEIATTIEEE